MRGPPAGLPLNLKRLKTEDSPMSAIKVLEDGGPRDPTMNAMPCLSPSPFRNPRRRLDSRCRAEDKSEAMGPKRC